jgi:hypothetical protein
MNTWTGDDLPVARPLPTHRTKQTQNKRRQTFMPRVRFEPTIPMFERKKAVHALECAATVIGNIIFHWIIYIWCSRLRDNQQTYEKIYTNSICTENREVYFRYLCKTIDNNIPIVLSANKDQSKDIGMLQISEYSTYMYKYATLLHKV